MPLGTVAVGLLLISGCRPVQLDLKSGASAPCYIRDDAGVRCSEVLYPWGDTLVGGRVSVLHQGGITVGSSDFSYFRSDHAGSSLIGVAALGPADGGKAVLAWLNGLDGTPHFRTVESFVSKYGYRVRETRSALYEVGSIEVTVLFADEDVLQVYLRSPASRELEVFEPTGAPYCEEPACKRVNLRRPSTP